MAKSVFLPPPLFPLSHARLAQEASVHRESEEEDFFGRREAHAGNTAFIKWLTLR